MIGSGKTELARDSAIYSLASGSPGGPQIMCTGRDTYWSILNFWDLAFKAETQVMDKFCDWDILKKCKYEKKS